MAEVHGIRRDDQGYWVRCDKCGAEFGPFARCYDAQETGNLCETCRGKANAEAEDVGRALNRLSRGLLRTLKGAPRRRR